ncbi:hypothetical protein M885DRAFT_531366, partial [Pelagophyceae sp. CCMP2097]
TAPAAAAGSAASAGSVAAAATGVCAAAEAAPPPPCAAACAADEGVVVGGSVRWWAGPDATEGTVEVAGEDDAPPPGALHCRRRWLAVATREAAPRSDHGGCREGRREERKGRHRHHGGHKRP